MTAASQKMVSVAQSRSSWLQDTAGECSTTDTRHQHQPYEAPAAPRSGGFSARSDDVKREILERASAEAGRAVRARAVRAVIRQERFAFDRLVSAGVREGLAADRDAVLGPAGGEARVVAR